MVYLIAFYTILCKDSRKLAGNGISCMIKARDYSIYMVFFTKIGLFWEDSTDPDQFIVLILSTIVELLLV